LPGSPEIVPGIPLHLAIIIYIDYDVVHVSDLDIHLTIRDIDYSKSRVFTVQPYTDNDFTVPAAATHLDHFSLQFARSIGEANDDLET
jgi:hypothetical protein